MLKNELISNELNRLERTNLDGKSLAQWLRRPEVTYSELPGKDAHLPLEVAEQVEITVKYSGYIGRQQMEADRMRALEDKQIPRSFSYAMVPSLRHEAKQKLEAIQPASIGQAARISGVTPADISVLLVWLSRGELAAAGEKHAD